MVSGQASTQTVASQRVVQDYLNVLLRDVLPDDDSGSMAETQTCTQDAAEINTVVPVALVSDEPPTLASAPVLQTAMAKEASARLSESQVAEPAAVAPDVARQESGRREFVESQSPATATVDFGAPNQNREPGLWAEKPFASLLFDVMGLKLAAPLHELGGIMPLDDKLQAMAAQADWFMGLIRWNGRTIRVVDTARFVMPERVAPEQALDYQSVVVLGDSHWALAVNNADQSVNLQPADIRWRKTFGKRPWLAGTVLDRLCALLDIDVLVAMLDASDTARQVKAELKKES